MSVFENLRGATPLLPVLHYVADLRPVADAAATKSETVPSPTMALNPFSPPSTAQAGAITKSAILALRGSDREGNPGAMLVDRTLKPYGVTMLPGPPEDNAVNHTETTLKAGSPVSDRAAGSA
jgi:hypothetical protein